jgi:tRNA-dihydrouridine synthase 3
MADLQNDVNNLSDGTTAPANKEAEVHPQAEILPGDSAMTKAEKIERHGDAALASENLNDDPPNKRIKLEHDSAASNNGHVDGRQRGVAPIKKEYLIDISQKGVSAEAIDDDAAEASGKSKPELTAGRGGAKTKGGQNTHRQFGSSRDAIELCRTRALANEFDAITCRFGDKCKHIHDIRKYLQDGKREDLSTFNDACPIWEARGKCNAGWRCRFSKSHSKEVDHEDGRKELVQVKQNENVNKLIDESSKDDEDDGPGIVNIVSNGDKITLRKKKHPLTKSDKYLQWLDKQYSRDDPNKKGKEDNRAEYVEPPLLPSEKRRIYYGPETPVLAPLTTQGNLPYRRLCVSLGAQVTWSEMAMGLPLLQGEKGEWALMKAHESELSPPAYKPESVVQGYDNTKDMRFGVQIAANKPWLAVKTTEALTNLCPRLRAIDLNCGCPIDLVFRQGAGSALLDTHGKLAKILRGMNTVSGEVPITVKIRMGTKDKQPTAEKLCQRLILGSTDDQEDGGPAGVAAITLHGRSRQQRYTKSADWEYIAECASLVKRMRNEHATATDTIREPDARDFPAGNSGLPYFCGNGDVLSHVDYQSGILHSKVDSIMIGRGALVKPWIFEEIETNQYLDKSATERLAYVEKFVRNGLEYWGSDEIGVGTTRRFLLEWLSFACRYVPLGLLEYLPPKFGDRPPAFRGRSELETLLSSPNYKDWIKIRYGLSPSFLPSLPSLPSLPFQIGLRKNLLTLFGAKISEMFLGPAHKDFNFLPKHKSNSYEIEAEG